MLQITLVYYNHVHSLVSEHSFPSQTPVCFTTKNCPPTVSSWSDPCEINLLQNCRNQVFNTCATTLGLYENLTCRATSSTPMLHLFCKQNIDLMLYGINIAIPANEISSKAPPCRLHASSQRRYEKEDP